MSETPKSEVSQSQLNQYIKNPIGNDEVQYEFDTISEACACIGNFMNENMEILSEPPCERSAFDASSEPVIGIVPYYERICRYSRLTPESACCALVLVRQICANPDNDLQLTNFNAHRLLLTASMVFAKFYDDDIDTNIRWAKIAGIKLLELNSLEIDLLNVVNFDLRVMREDFDVCLNDLLLLRDHVPKAQDCPSAHPVTRAPSTKAASHRSPPNNRDRQAPHTIQFSPQSSSRAGGLSPHATRVFASPSSYASGPSPPSSHPASPTNFSKDKTRSPDLSETPSPIMSPHGHGRRRTVSGALVAFFHNHPRFHNSHHGSNPHQNGAHHGSQNGMQNLAPAAHEGVEHEHLPSPMASPHHGFHIRLPRTSSLQSITNLLHVSPRFNRSKHTHKKHHHDGIGPAGQRDSLEIPCASHEAVMGFVSRPAISRQNDAFVPPAIPSRHPHPAQAHDLPPSSRIPSNDHAQDLPPSSCIPSNARVGPDVLANVLAH